jgi:phosphoribosylformimino-5-aminoimidazole carboxamide ribotide isomerase
VPNSFHQSKAGAGQNVPLHKGRDDVTVLGVLDLLRGRAVHARGGARERYQPVVKGIGSPIPAGDALALAAAYLGELGADELYVADLDAILGGQVQHDLVSKLTVLGAPVWLDAGTRSATEAVHAHALGVSRVVVGLETLPSYEALDEICRAANRKQVAFSLDLRHGQPLVSGDSEMAGHDAAVIAARAARSGVGAIIVLDLARVGTGSGVDLDLIARVRDAAPQVMLLIGGGVRGAEDLARLKQAGCDGALVASALLSGALRLTRSSDGSDSPPPSRS